MTTTRRTIAVIVLTALVGATYWLLWQSPYLEIRKVTFSVENPAGHGWKDPTLRARVIDAFPHLAGQHLISIDGSQLAKQVKQTRGVLAAEVRRGWPHQVAVIVTPRVPVAVFEKRGASVSRWQYVDADAQVVAEAAQRPANWVVLTVSPATAGGRAAIAVWNSLPTRIKSEAVSMSSSSVESSATVTMALRTGATVFWGAPDQLERKAQVLTALLHYPAKVYDISAPDVPTTTK